MPQHEFQKAEYWAGEGKPCEPNKNLLHGDTINKTPKSRQVNVSQGWLSFKHVHAHKQGWLLTCVPDVHRYKPRSSVVIPPKKTHAELSAALKQNHPTSAHNSLRKCKKGVRAEDLTCAQGRLTRTLPGPPGVSTRAHSSDVKQHTPADFNCRETSPRSTSQMASV